MTPDGFHVLDKDPDSGTWHHHEAYYESVGAHVHSKDFSIGGFQGELRVDEASYKQLQIGFQADYQNLTEEETIPELF
jgi:hypothetical protein